MIYNILAGKIHGATVTEANVDYVGSIGISKELLEETGIKINEKVHVWDIDNGNRLETYVIEAHIGKIEMNGAAALKIEKGHKVIIACFRGYNQDEVDKIKPKIVFPDDKNRL